MKVAAANSATWPDEVIQLLDDHHVIALSRNPAVGRQHGAALADRLNLMADTQVHVLDGRRVADLPTLISHVGHELGASTPMVAQGRGEVRDLIDLLRSACAGPKRRYFIWHDADATIQADADLFCRAVNAFFGIAAECEFVSLDPVVLLRMAFIGGPLLTGIAQDAAGPFCKWLDTVDGTAEAFWEVASLIERPPVITCRIDD